MWSRVAVAVAAIRPTRVLASAVLKCLDARAGWSLLEARGEEAKKLETHIRRFSPRRHNWKGRRSGRSGKAVGVETPVHAAPLDSMGSWGWLQQRSRAKSHSFRSRMTGEKEIQAACLLMGDKAKDIKGDKERGQRQKAECFCATCVVLRHGATMPIPSRTFRQLFYTFSLLLIDPCS